MFSANWRINHVGLTQDYWLFISAFLIKKIRAKTFLQIFISLPLIKISSFIFAIPLIKKWYF